MRRYLLPLLLLFSLGINTGLIVDRAKDRVRDRHEDPRPAGVEVDRRVEDGAASDRASPDRAIPPRLMTMLERMAGELSLEGEARARFLEVQERFFRRSIEMRRRSRAAQRALRGEFLSGQPDRQRAEALLRQGSEAQAAIEQAFIDNYFETRSLLDRPEQLERFHHFMARVRHLRQEMEERIEERRRQRFGATLDERREERRERRRQRRDRQREGTPPPL